MSERNSSEPRAQNENTNDGANDNNNKTGISVSDGLEERFGGLRVEDLLTSLKSFSSRPSSPAVSKRVKNDELVAAFRNFLQKNLSLENLDAFNAIESFRNHANLSESSPDSILNMANKIYVDYVDPDSDLQVNLDFSLRSALKEELDEKSKKREKGFTFSVNSDIFDPMQRAIFVLLQEDSFPKFVKSDIYKHYLEEEKGKEKIKHEHFSEINREEKEKDQLKPPEIPSSPSTAIRNEKKKEKKEKKSSHNPSPQGSFFNTFKLEKSTDQYPKEKTDLPNIEAPVPQLNVELLQIIDKSNLIISLLKEADSEASEEFVYSLKQIQHEIEQIMKSKVTELPEVPLKELRVSLRDYLILIQLLASNSRLPSALNIYRSYSRLKLAQLNYKTCKAHQEMTAVVRSFFLLPYQPTPSSSSSSSKNLHNLVDQASLDAFWKSHFGTLIYVPYDDFVVALGKTLKTTILPEDSVSIKQIVDHSNQNIACKCSFGSLLKMFGPIQSEKLNCHDRVRQLYRQKWFFGFLTKGEAEAFLYDEPPGTFFCRIPKLNSNSLHVNYIDHKKRICSYSVTPKGEGIVSYDHHSYKEKHFSSIFEMVRSQNETKLKTPYVSSIPFEPWYWGDITTTETIEMISTYEEFSFVVRLVASPNPSYAASYVNNGKVKHSLIRRDGSGYHITGDETKSHGDLKSLIVFYQKTLKNPIPSPSYCPSHPSITGIPSPSNQSTLTSQVNPTIEKQEDKK